MLNRESEFRLSAEKKEAIWMQMQQKKNNGFLRWPIILSGVAATIIMLFAFRFWTETMDTQILLIPENVDTEQLVSKVERPILVNDFEEKSDIEISQTPVIIYAGNKPVVREQVNIQRPAYIETKTLEVNQGSALTEIAQRIQNYTVSLLLPESNQSFDAVVYQLKQGPDEKKLEKKQRFKFRLNLFNSDNRITNESVRESRGFTLASSER
ncbi:MAG: hypothetical protein JEZ03_08660 [Bacteroidales bacterium]|nr:hypothetical protein [Bacteroidales bacterium]